MGTRFELVLVEPDPGPDPERVRRRLRAAGAQALEVIEACDARWSAFRRDSLVARIRREAEHAPVRVDEQTWTLLEASLDLWHATGGAFDVGLGGALEALGFRDLPASEDEAPVPRTPPYELDSSSRAIRVTRAGALLDLGGVAKGYALDLAARELREAGVGCALLHGGASSVFALGAPEVIGSEGSPSIGWRVAIQAEGDGAPTLVARLADASLSVSAPRGRTALFVHGPPEAGARSGHVIDPFRGRGTEVGSTSCVVAPGGLVADALATALVVETARRQNRRPSGTVRIPAVAGAAHAVHEADERRWHLSGQHESVFHLEPDTDPPQSKR